VIGIWSAFLLLCLLGKGGRLLVPLFPLGSVAVGLFLYFRAPVLYIGYVWWVFFLCSLVRRIIDQQSGYVTPGRWNTTSLLVTSICLITLVKYLPKISRQGGLPFLLSLLAIAYGCLVGLINGRPDLQFFIGAMGWLIPIVFSFHLFTNWQDYPQYRQVMQRTFVVGVLVMGGYGILQYCTAPEWDRFYMNNLDASSFGQPFPFEIRVFGTQGSPQDFANTMMAGLILILSSNEPLRFAASGAGYITFLLTAARAVWLGWVAGLFAFLPALSLKLQMRLILTILLMALMIVPLSNIEPFATPIQQRLASLSDTQSGDDVSLQERTQGYEDLLAIALTEVVGSGIGGQGRALPASAIGGSDSGILPLLFTLGWLGTLPYLMGIGLIVYSLFQTKESRNDPFSSASRAIVFASIAQVGFNNIFATDATMILWSFLGIGMAASKYYSHQRQRIINQSISTTISTTL